MSDALLVLCPQCLTKNRVPPGRDRRAARCGRCHAPLFDGRLLTLPPSQFDAFMSGQELPVLVDFWAPWCAPCRALHPVLAGIARDFATRLRVVRINLDGAPALASRLGIAAVPTLSLWQGGVERARHSALLARTALAAWLARHLAGGEAGERAAAS